MDKIEGQQKDIIRVKKHDMIGLVETKTSGKQADSICKKIGFDYWVRVEAVGFSGGIWVFWKEHLGVELLVTHP